MKLFLDDYLDKYSTVIDFKLDESENNQKLFEDVENVKEYSKELKTLKSKLQGFKLVEINQNIINLSTQIIENYSLSHGAKIQDSIIASTCLIHDLRLHTLPNLEIV